MKRNKLVSIGVIGIVIVSLAVAVTATSLGSNTPLYTVRMEQASSKMNFLPTEMNEFTYTAEKGYTIDYDLQADYDYSVLPLGGPTCQHTCPYTCSLTCPNGICQDKTCGHPICQPTCGYTCEVTCPVICPDTR